MEGASSWPFDTPIGRARNIAIMLAKKNGSVCADEVFRYLEERLPEVLKEIPPNGWGSVFKSPKLKFTGRVKESEKVSRHAGLQRIWSYQVR
jgi:hypothetical protein